MNSLIKLSDLLDLDSGTLTPILKRMESAHLVKRQRSTEDERILEVYITEEGLSLRKKALCIPEALLASSV